MARIELVTEQTFGDGEEFLMGGIRDIDVDSEGRVYIADTYNTVHVLSHDGSHIGKIGGRGEGPGEFQSLISINVYDNQLYVFDYGPRRMTVFLLGSLSLSHVVNFSAINWGDVGGLTNVSPAPLSVRSDDTYLVRFVQMNQPGEYDIDRYNVYYVVDRDGRIISDRIHKERGVEYLVSRRGNLLMPPFIRRTLVAVSDDGLLFSAWSEDFLIKVYDENGEYLHAIYYPYAQSQLRRQDLLDLHDDNPLLQREYQDATLPDTWPALNSMLVDDESRIWVSTITDDEYHYTWWVLDEQGRLLARFPWPGQRLQKDIFNVTPIVVRNGFFYIREVDEESGLEVVAKYRIDMSY